MLPLVRLSTLTCAIHPAKAVGGVPFSMLGYISIRVRFCEATVDFGKVLINPTLN